jgi:two-component system sensor histidine kinase/response regulator
MRKLRAILAADVVIGSHECRAFVKAGSLRADILHWKSSTSRLNVSAGSCGNTDDESAPIIPKITSSIRRSLGSVLKRAVPGNLMRGRIADLNTLTCGTGVRVWQWDVPSNTLQFSHDLIEIFGLDAAAARRSPSELMLRCVHPDDHERFQREIGAALKSASRFDIEHRVLLKDGSVRATQLRGEISRSADGEPLRVVGVAIDMGAKADEVARIAEQNERQNQLLRRLKLATEAADISVWEQDLVSDEFEDDGTFFKLFGLEPVSKFNPADSIHPDERREKLAPIFAALGDPQANGILTLRHRTSNPRPEPQYVQTHIRVYRGANGAPQRLLGVTWDVTKEVLHAAQLERIAHQERALMERLSVATKAAGVSPWEFDLVADRFSWCGTALPCFGLDNLPLDEYRRRLHDIVVEADRQILRDAPRAAVANRSEFHEYTFRVHGIDGEIHHIHNYARLLRSADGEPSYIVGVTRDVSREVAANEMLKKQAEENRRLIDQLNMAAESAGIASWDIDLIAQRYTSIKNPIKALGLAAEEYGHLSRFSQRMLPDDRNKLRDAILEASKHGKDSIRYRYRFMARDHSLVHVQSIGRVLFDDSKTPVRVIGVSYDTTDEVNASNLLQQQAEQLRLAERRLERASLSSFEGHWEADLVTGQLWYSSSFRTLLGYREEELTHDVAALQFLIHPEDHAAYRAAWQEHIARTSTYDIEIRLRMADGEYKWFRMRGMAERDADGLATVMAGSIQDVHQQRLTEDALKAAQARFERAINGTEDGLWEIDIASNTNWCSPRLVQLLGYEHFEPEFLNSIIHPEDLLKIDEAMRAHCDDNAPFDLEIRVKHAAGAYRWYRSRASAERDALGKALRLSGSLQDVTEARAAREELMRATEAAQAASRAKSQFLANVSHEIRTPMNGIIGMTGLLQDTSLDRTQREYAETVRSSADSLLTVINDILDFSKIEAGKLDLETIEMDLRANVEDVGAMLAFQAASKGLELIVNIHPDLPSMVLGDPQRLRQCVINLVSNAIKFTQSGEIVIEVRPERGSDGTAFTYFEISDTGMGIDPDTLSTLFQPFVQADASTTRHFGGTGLGLSIVRRLVELMGGEVGVSSEAGKGSRFYFLLPLKAAEPILPPAPVRSGASGRILIVDDNLTNQKVLGSLLSHAGYQVAATGSAKSALPLLESAVADGAAFDMVITDYQMPEMDGATLGECIVSTPSLSATRLVMLTSLDRHGDTPRLSALGFAAYLTKPVRGKELLQAVTKVMSGEPRQWQMDTQPMITRNTLAQAATQQRFSGQVLLVEDNLVNQKVAARFLERLGCTVEVAGNGAEGLAAAQARHFDLILMDLQMPVMDGMTATRKIRELETLRHTPIIALTANAMTGDRERCEAAGMDDYLTKPIEVERLRAALSRFGLALPEGAAPAGATASEHRSGSTGNMRPPIDLRALNDLIDGDSEFARDLAITFIDSGEQQLVEMARAAASGNRDALAKSAHKLKGACANIHAPSLRSMAQRLENDSKTAAPEALESSVAALRQEFARAKQFLSDPQVIAPAAKAAS